jgi:transmembrane sensor
MNKNELKLLAQKYLDGTATEAEKLLLHQWYDATGNDWVEIINTSVPETEQDIKQRIFSKIETGITAEDGNTFTKIDVKRHISVQRLALWASSIAAALLIGFFAWNLNKPQQSSPVIADGQIVSVPKNRIMQITLPDGSKVWLNSGSEFRYPKKFNGKVREVELVEGRAFFDVKHETKHPFIVKTKDLNVTVLGTSFDVRSYFKEGSTKVSVVTGKVGITIPGEPDKPAIYLLPKQEIVLSKTSNQLIKEPTPEAAVDAWCKNVQVFEQENLSIVFKAIEKKYNAHIIVENKKLLDEKVTFNLSNQPLDSTIETLSYTKHFNYKIANDSTIVIK